MDLNTDKPFGIETSREVIEETMRILGGHITEVTASTEKPEFWSVTFTAKIEFEHMPIKLVKYSIKREDALNLIKTNQSPKKSLQGTELYYAMKNYERDMIKDSTPCLNAIKNMMGALNADTSVDKLADEIARMKRITDTAIETEEYQGWKRMLDDLP